MRQYEPSTNRLKKGKPMTEKDIEREIKREERRIKSLENKIEDIKFDIQATRTSILFWKKELEKVRKANAKKEKKAK